MLCTGRCVGTTITRNTFCIVHWRKKKNEKKKKLLPTTPLVQRSRVWVYRGGGYRFVYRVTAHARQKGPRSGDGAGVSRKRSFRVNSKQQRCALRVQWRNGRPERDENRYCTCETFRAVANTRCRDVEYIHDEKRSPYIVIQTPPNGNNDEWIVL